MKLIESYAAALVLCMSLSLFTQMLVEYKSIEEKRMTLERENTCSKYILCLAKQKIIEGRWTDFVDEVEALWPGTELKLQELPLRIEFGTQVNRKKIMWNLKNKTLSCTVEI